MGPNKSRSLLVLAMLLIQVFFLSNTNATSLNQSESITIEQLDGMTFEEELYINGSSTTSLQNFDWYLIDIFTANQIVLESGKLSTVSSISEGHWEWTLRLNVSNYDCTCRILVAQVGDLHLSPHNNRIVYIGNLNHSPFIHPVELIFESSSLYDFLLADNSLSITIPVVVPPTSLDEIIVKLNVCIAPNNVCKDPLVSFNEFNFSILDSEIILVLEPEIVELSDGFWKFEITVFDKFLRSSNVETISLLIDQNPPIVEVSCDVLNLNDLSESTPAIYENENISFSARIDDGYEGSDNILTWTLVQPDGSRRALSTNETISDTMITITPNTPGQWSVELLVRDTSGRLLQSTHQFEVVNLVPNVIVELDSLILSDNSSIVVELNGAWELNSSSSSDSPNDQNTLKSTWLVNGIPLSTDGKVLNSSSFDGQGIYDVRLVIEDDNGAISEFEFQLNIEDTSIADSENVNRVLIVVSFVISLFIGGSLSIYIARGKSKQTSVPKWTKNPQNKSEKELEFDKM